MRSSNGGRLQRAAESVSAAPAEARNSWRTSAFRKYGDVDSSIDTRSTGVSMCRCLQDLA
jgi:hypothetical protein